MDELYTTIYELETSLLKPEVRSSREQLGATLAADFKEFGSSGLIYTKQDILERLPATTDKIDFTISDFEMEVLSENLVMTHFLAHKVINDAEKVSSLRTSLWRHEDGVWKIFFHQGTMQSQK